MRLAREVLGPDHEVTLSSLNNLASLYLARGGWKEAEPLLSEALAGNRRVRGAEHPSTLGTMDNLASVLGQQGRLAEAETIRREVLAVRTRTQGREHQATLVARSSVAQNLLNQGSAAQLAESERLFLENLEISRRVNGERARFTNTVRANLGNLYDEQGRLPEAETMLRDALAGLRESNGPRHPVTLNAIESLGFVMLRERKYREAEPVLRELVAARGENSPQPWRRGYAQSLLGASLSGQRRFAEAEPLVVGGYEGMTAHRAAIPAFFNGFIVRAGRHVVDLYTAWGKPSQADEWRKKLAASS